MKYALLPIVIIIMSLIFVFLYSDINFTRVTLEEKNTCPIGKEALCKQVEELENLYTQLSEQPGFKKQDLLQPLQAIALGYAHIGDIGKSKEYYQIALEIDPKGQTSATGYNSNANKLARILEQYIYNEQYEGAIAPLMQETVHPALCLSVVQTLTYKNKVDLVEKVLKDTNCSPAHLSDGAVFLNKDDIVGLYNRINEIYKASSKEDFINDWRKEANSLLSLVAKKSLETEEHPHIPQNLEDDALAYEPLLRYALHTLIHFYAENNDIKALELSRLRTNRKVSRGTKTIIVDTKIVTDIPVCLKDSKTEVTFLILTDPDGSNHKSRLSTLKQLLRRVAKDSETADITSYKYIKDICSSLTFKECLFSQIQESYEGAQKEEKIYREKNPDTPTFSDINYWQANAAISNYDYVHDFEKQYKDKITPTTLKALYSYIAEKQDCETFFRDDIEKLQDKTSSLETSAYALQCLVTTGQTEKYLSEDNNNTRLMSKLAQTYVATYSKNYPQSFPYETIRLLNNAKINKEIKESILSALIRQRIQLFDRMDEVDQEKLFDAIDAYIIDGNNYNPSLINKIHEFYARRIDRYERAENLLNKSPKFQQYIKKNIKDRTLINHSLQIKYNDDLNKNLTYRIKKLSLEITRKVNEYSVFKPYQIPMVWMHPI